MATFLDICLRLPNLGTMLFIIVFVVAIPSYLYMKDDIDSFKYYFPFLVMLAVTLTEAGKPHSFQKLYPMEPDDVSSFLSVNLINGLAMVGLLLQCVAAALKFKSLTLGVTLGVITFAITFPIAQQLLPYFIREGDVFFQNVSVDGQSLKYPGNWHKYFLGFSFIIFLLGLEYILIIGASQQIFGSSGKSNAVVNSLNLN
tara:strand:+ start:3013 stop:3612 length:600 start_codon:yes stop_codon:yes gene_type:complete